MLKTSHFPIGLMIQNNDKSNKNYKMAAKTNMYELFINSYQYKLYIQISLNLLTRHQI